jgi:hypothetical protein
MRIDYSAIFWKVGVILRSETEGVVCKITQQTVTQRISVAVRSISEQGNPLLAFVTILEYIGIKFAAIFLL